MRQYPEMVLKAILQRAIPATGPWTTNVEIKPHLFGFPSDYEGHSCSANLY